MNKKKPLRVLIADDEERIRTLIKRVVLKLGYTIASEAETGLEAIELYRKERPDLLLLDIKMPLKDGDEALGEIISEFPEACVIMMTSVAESDTVKKCIKLGAVDYILKTNPIKSIRDRIVETYQTWESENR